MVGPGPACRLCEMAIVTRRAPPPVVPSPTAPRRVRGGPISAVVLVVGAALYAAAETSGTVPFAATPLAIGVIVVIAAILHTRRCAVATGLVLTG